MQPKRNLPGRGVRAPAALRAPACPLLPAVEVRQRCPETARARESRDSRLRTARRRRRPSERVATATALVPGLFELTDRRAREDFGGLALEHSAAFGVEQIPAEERRDVPSGSIHGAKAAVHVSVTALHPQAVGPAPAPDPLGTRSPGFPALGSSRLHIARAARSVAGVPHIRSSTSLARFCRTRSKRSDASSSLGLRPEQHSADPMTTTQRKNPRCDLPQATAPRANRRAALLREESGCAAPAYSLGMANRFARIDVRREVAL